MNPCTCIRACAAAALLLLLPTFAAAVPVTWNLAGVRFSDNGIATGSFVYDADTHTLVDWKVSVNGGVVPFAPQTYDKTNSEGSLHPEDGQAQPEVLLVLRGAAMRHLRITPATAFSNAGGLVKIDLTTPSRSGSIECFNCAPARTIDAGYLVGVPGTATFTGAAAVSGNWYDPAQDGHGFQFEVLGNNIVTAFWFTFDPAGNQIWINGVGSLVGNKVQMQAARVLGGRFPPAFDPTKVTKPSWGTIVVTFFTCTQGVAEYFPDDPAYGVVGSMYLQRLTAVAGVSCPP